MSEIESNIIQSLRRLASTPSLNWSDEDYRIYGDLILLYKRDPERIMRILNDFMDSYGNTWNTFLIDNFISDLSDFYTDAQLSDFLDKLQLGYDSELRKILEDRS